MAESRHASFDAWCDSVVMGLKVVWMIVSDTKKSGLARQMGQLWSSFLEATSDLKVGKS